ncbi:hypothetical protein OTK49_02365 [Vibrio coralliirubri]|uniref:hypothetical protein n=1 Tax=Vibrio coralliirubri TaxID=1516159 RepID=UPI002284CBDF|nr:hypothetical protein [Vibrio coralliirubri]MCY9861360.1 hypothetical protein [Vibrio coralliirubri]
MEPSKIQAALRQLKSDPSILNSPLLRDVLPRLAEVVDFNVDPRDLFKVMSEKLSSRDIDSSVESIRTQMLKALVSIHMNKEMTFDECQTQMRAISRMSREMEVELRDSKHPVNKLTIKQMVVPTVPNVEREGRLIEYLRLNKLITKTEITNIAKKVEAYYELSGKANSYPALAEIGLSFPEIFNLKGDAVYKANPTYRVLNLCLKKLGLPDLSSVEGRDHYKALEFNHLENIEALVGKRIELPNNSLLLLNAISEYATKWAETHKTELEQRRHDSDIAVIAFCASTLVGSIVATVAAVRPISDIAGAIVALSLPDEINKGTPKTLANIIYRKNIASYDLYSLIRPFNETEYALETTDAIYGLDEHLLNFDSKKPLIDKTLVDIVINKGDSLTALKNIHFGGLVRNFIKHTEDENLVELIERALDSEGLAKNEIKHILDLKNQLENWGEHLRKSPSFSLDDEFDATPELILMLRSALTGIDSSQAKIDKLVEMKSQLDEAYKNNNYAVLGELAIKIKNFNVAEIVLDIRESIQPVIAELTTISVFKDGLLYYVNREQVTSSSESATSNDSVAVKEAKDLNKKLRGMERDAKRLTNTNNELTAELAASKSNVKELEAKLNKPNSYQSISELEKKFLFGEKTSIMDAVNLIKWKFPHVVFADDIDTQLEECMYVGSTKLLKFLHLLVGDYFDAISKGTPDSVAKDILGKAYRANESASVLSNQRLKRQRMFNIEGESTLLTKHLSIGTSRDLRNSCSIYFDIADDKVIIGYIGEHLDNTLT